MPIYLIRNRTAEKIETEEFKDEKDLQNFLEANLKTIFGLTFIATEYWTGGSDGGYIDTIALDENDSPTVVEYKWGENENVINQGLYYIDQILEHQGDFENKVRKELGKEVKVNWKQPRLILVAKSYNRYDQHAVKRVGGNIELVRYTKYENNIFHLETVYTGGTSAKKPSIVKSQKSDQGEDPLKERLDWIAKDSPSSLKLYTTLRELILSLDENISEKRFKNGSQFRLENKVFVALAPWKSYTRVYLVIKNKPNDPKNIVASNEGKGKLFASNYDFQINDLSNIDYAMNIIKQTYKSLL